MRFNMRGCSRDPLAQEPRAHQVAMASDMHEAPPHPFLVWVDRHCTLLLVIAFILMVVVVKATYDPAFDNNAVDYRP